MRILMLTELFFNSIMLAHAVDGSPLDWYLLEQIKRGAGTSRCGTVGLCGALSLTI
jgi:hypothetical protein